MRTFLQARSKKFHFIELSGKNSAIMSNRMDFPELARHLKRLLKQKGITYRDLAKTLKISESSVKKIFISGDCSLARLNEICAAVDVDLADLMTAAREQVPEKFHFTAKQQQFLFENRRCFQVYWKLVYEEQSPEEIRRNLRLTESVLFNALRSLDQLGLIELLPNGKVRHPDMNMVLWEGSGPLIDMVRKEWAPLMTKRIGEKADSSGYGLSLRYFTLRPESAEEFKRTISEIQIEFGRRSVRETRLNRAATVPVFMVSAFSPTCFVEEL